jgi:hypothetical protein
MDRSSDLEAYREQFLNQLHSSTPDLKGHDRYMQYWKRVEQEAGATEELGKLEDWVRGLARDKDRVRALKNKLETASTSDPAAQAVLQIILQILMLLEDIEQKLTRRRDQRRRVLGWMLLKAGPGVKKKLPPKGGKKGDGKKEEEEVSETVLGKPKPVAAKKPTKKMSR